MTNRCAFDPKFRGQEREKNKKKQQKNDKVLVVGRPHPPAHPAKPLPLIASLIAKENNKKKGEVLN